MLSIVGVTGVQLYKQARLTLNIATNFLFIGTRKRILSLVDTAREAPS